MGFTAMKPNFSGEDAFRKYSERKSNRFPQKIVFFRSRYVDVRLTAL